MSARMGEKRGEEGKYLHGHLLYNMLALLWYQVRGVHVVVYASRAGGEGGERGGEREGEREKIQTHTYTHTCLAGLGSLFSLIEFHIGKVPINLLTLPGYFTLLLN